jgi:hypothetical protein
MDRMGNAVGGRIPSDDEHVACSSWKRRHRTREEHNLSPHNGISRRENRVPPVAEVEHKQGVIGQYYDLAYAAELTWTLA